MTCLSGAARGVIATLAAFAVAGCGLLGGDGDEAATPTVGNRTPILSRIEAGTTADASIASVAVVLPTAQRNAEWAQPGGNARNAMGHLELAETPAPLWRTRIPGTSTRRRLGAAPVIGNGTMFVVDTAGAIRALDSETGGERWRVQLDLPGEFDSQRFGGGVSYAGGQVFATDGTGNVVALDANTGGEIWRVRPAGPLRGAPTVAFSSVYVMTQDNQVYSLNVADGSTQWFDVAPGGDAGVFGVAAPAAGQGTVIAGYSSGELSAYRYENGRNLWSDALARTSISNSVGTLTDVDADPIIDSGRVYALGQGGRMAAYELVTGQRLWELNIAGISTPAVAGEWLFVLTDDSRMLAVQRSSGRVRWITQLPAFRDPEDRRGAIYWTGPVLAGNHLWVASSRGTVARLDVGSGTMGEIAQLGEGVSLPPLVANGTLYILDDSGTIHAYR